MFALLAFAMLGGSIWGAAVLAGKWAKGPWARLFIGATLTVVFWITGMVAVVAGCTAIYGPVRIQ
jgi:hypothetical protein